MRVVVAFALSAIVFATRADAQGIMSVVPDGPFPLEAPRPPATSSVFSANGTVRITTTFRIAVATKDTESLNDAKAQEDGRRRLYGMAAGECEIIAEAFKAECRLNSFSISSLATSRPPTNMMAATAVYELKPAWKDSAK
jgi:hypothetical protein